jgi:SAM-dependent methyltransferase
MHDPNLQWERFGSADPYYGVYSIDEFRRENLDDDALERFFASGDEHVERVLALARSVAGEGFAPATVLDHGCGVGRLAVPFAERAEHVTGVDVSPSMLAEARRNCDARGLDHVDLVGADRLGSLAPEFDLVHSFIVLQHIPPREGMAIVGRLASLLRPGGVGVLHVPIAARHWLDPIHTWATRTLPWVPNLVNVARGRPWSYPYMQMNVYRLNALALLLARQGIRTLQVELDAGEEKPGGYASAYLVFARPADEPASARS